MSTQPARKLLRFFPLLISINFIIIVSCFELHLAVFMPALCLGLMVYMTFTGLALWFQKPGLNISSSALCILLMSLAYSFYLLAGECLIAKTSLPVSMFNHPLNMQTLKLISLLILSNILIGSWTGSRMCGKTHRRGNAMWLNPAHKKRNNN